MKFHDRVLERARALGVAHARVLHRGRRPHLTGVVDGVHFVLGLPVRPRDLSQNYFNCLRDLRRIISSIRKRMDATAA